MFFTEYYHHSIQKEPKKASSPTHLRWELQKIADRRYIGCSRIENLIGLIPPFGYVSHDGMKPVGIYVAMRGRDVSDGIYAYDSDGEGRLVRIHGKDEMKRLAEAFPDKDFVLDTPILVVLTGVLERSVARFKESAYAHVLEDVGACAASIMLHERAKGAKVFPLAGFVDDQVAVSLGLPSTEVPLAAISVFPEYSELAYDSVDDGVGESAYSNRNEANPLLDNVLQSDLQTMDLGRYPSIFMKQNRMESIEDLSKCIKVRRLATQALPGDEFPLTPARYDANAYLREIENLKDERKRRLPFARASLDLDEFSSLLRLMDMGAVNLFGAGLLKIWIVAFDVMFVYPGVYRYVAVRKSIYMQSGAVPMKKFAKLHEVPEEAMESSFAVILSCDIPEACKLLGERAYRYLQMNAGAIVESLDLTAKTLGKSARSGVNFYEAELRTLCEIPETESLLGEILIGK